MSREFSSSDFFDQLDPGAFRSFVEAGDAVGVPAWSMAASMLASCWFFAAIGCLPFAEVPS
jgi:hypothetical protein